MAERTAGRGGWARRPGLLDFPYGYPAGFAAALGVEASWMGVWRYLTDQVEDNARNKSNRFQVAAGINQMLGADAPVWGRPATQPNAYLPEKKNVTYGRLSEWRQAERTLHDAGLHPQSVWKLAYAGSVGSQALLGIPVVHRLRWDSQLQGVSLVWPFEITVPSIPAGRPGVVHAEIWPSAAPFDHESGSCPDEQQVRAVVRLWQDQDQRETLGQIFAAVPADEDIRREEGWILGIGSTGDGAQPPTPSARRNAPRQRQRGLHPCECGCAHGTRTLPARPRCQTPLATDESSSRRRRASQSQVGRAGLVTSSRRWRAPWPERSGRTIWDTSRIGRIESVWTSANRHDLRVRVLDSRD